MISENKWEQFGYQRQETDIKGITIHNTNNYKMNAKELFDWLENESKDSSGCHYLVDDENTIEVMPINWAVYHTGKGNDFGNHYTIAIEICSNLNDEKYFKGQDNAIKLIKKLMNKYKLSIDNIYFHKDFDNQMYCPANILQIYKTKNEFLKLIEGN